MRIRLDLCLVASEGIREHLADLQKEHREAFDLMEFELHTLKIRACEAEEKILQSLFKNEYQKSFF